MAFVFRRSYRGPVRAVILDWAGTTVDYGSCAPAMVFIEVFKRQGIEITLEQAREPMGTHKRVHIEKISKMPPVAERWQQVHGRSCTDADIERLYQEFVPLQLACLAAYADLVPGTLEAVRDFRRRGLKVGTTTGYNGEMLKVLLSEAKKRGFEPDASVCATDVPAGRPAPWMALRCAMEMQVYPLESCVKIGDTVPDIDEGLNAGMWTIGVVMSGNEIGLTPRQITELPASVLHARRAAGYDRLHRAGAHYVVDSIAEVPPILEQIDRRLAQGEKP